MSFRFFKFYIHLFIQGKLTFFVKKPRDKDYKVFMGAKNITFDICQVLSGKAQSVFLDILAKDISKYSNAFHACPFTVSYCYYLCRVGLSYT